MREDAVRSTTTSLSESEPALAMITQLLRPEEINSLQEHQAGSVYTPYVTVLLMILQRLHGNASLVALLQAAPAWAGEHPLIVSGQLSSNTGGFSRARTRLDVEVAESFADRTFAALEASSRPSWCGRRVLLLDGTTLSRTSHDGLRKAFPPASNQYGTSAWPIVQCVVAHDLASGCALRPEIGTMYGSKSVGEVALALKLLPRIGQNSVLLADRNFGVFGFVHAAHQAGHDTVTRLTKSRFHSLVRRARRLDDGVWELDWKPSVTDRRTHPKLPQDAQVTIRLHAVPGRDERGEGITLWIATTLAVTDEQVGEFYRLRQNVETDIRDIKVALKLRELRGQSASMVRKEIALGLVAYNLVVQVRRAAAERGGIEPRRLSFTGCWTLVKVLLEHSPDATLEKFTKQFEIALRGCLQRKLPHRPGRHYPRQKLPRSRTYPTRKHVPSTPS